MRYCRSVEKVWPLKAPESGVKGKLRFDDIAARRCNMKRRRPSKQMGDEGTRREGRSGREFPEPNGDGSLSSWGLRGLLGFGAHPIGISDEQLKLYESWGLIKRADDGRWSPDAVGLVREIHAVAKRRRRLLPMPRRVIYLRGNFFRFPVPPPTVVRAFQEMPLLRAGDRKMRAFVKERARRLEAIPQREWALLLRRPEVARSLEPRIYGYYRWTRDFYGVGATVRKLEDPIPFEERIYLFAVLDALTIARRQTRTS